jgi:hypothetical protein
MGWRGLGGGTPVSQLNSNEVFILGARIATTEKFNATYEARKTRTTRTKVMTRREAATKRKMITRRRTTLFLP